MVRDDFLQSGGSEGRRRLLTVREEILTVGNYWDQKRKPTVRTIELLLSLTVPVGAIMRSPVAFSL